MAPPIKIGASLQEFVSSELTSGEWKPYAKKLHNAGIVEIVLAGLTPPRVLVESATMEAARKRDGAVIYAQARRYTVHQSIDWESPTACRNALDELVRECQGFDKITRFRLAASDMGIVAGAARALIDANENDGPARLYDRVIETGMVVTYMRPFLESNKAGIGRTWWPRDSADQALHAELNELRHEYHAHAAHTPLRRLEDVWERFGEPGRRPAFAESWSRLSATKLRAIEQLAGRLGSMFTAEADRLDLELFGPRD